MDVEETQVLDDVTTLENERTNHEAESEAGSQTEEESATTRQPETAEQRKARLSRQIARAAEKEGLTVEDYLGISKEDAKEVKSESVTADERYDRLELKTEGFKDRGEQDIVLDYMRYKKVDVATALKSAAVRAELQEYRDRSSTPSPSTRTASAPKGVEWWAKQVEAGKPNSPDAAMRKQVRDYLSKKLS